MSLKLFFDPLSQPSRALYITLKYAKIPFIECYVNIRNGEHQTEEFGKISKFHRLPVVQHGDFKICESVGILRYLAREFDLLSELYPKDSRKQALVDEYLEWQHNNIRTYNSMYFQKKIIPFYLTGSGPDPEKIVSYERRMINCLNDFEELWLSSGDFVTGDKFTAADIWAACEMEQPRMVGYEPTIGRPIITKWLNRVRQQANPHYEFIHQTLNEIATLYKESNKS